MWPGLNKQVTAWCRDCQPCQRAKVTRHVKSAVQPIPVPGRRFAHVHVDLVGPLPATAAGQSYLFTMVDRATRWAEAVPLGLTSAADCAAAFIGGWVSRFGVLEVLTSDRGVQFTSELWRVLCYRLGLHHIKTTAYHPQANGLVERFHRRLKETLRARSSGSDWDKHLPWVLLGLRSSPREDSALSSAEVLFGAPLALPGDFLSSAEPPPAVFLHRLRQPVDQLPTRPLTYAEAAGSLPAALLAASFVYVRRGASGTPLSPVYTGPFQVLRPGKKFFVVSIGGREETVSVDRLKPHLGPSPVLPASPPPRGRPRKDVAVGGRPAANLAGGSVAANAGNSTGENPQG